jgi:predicted RNase H-related nuclease YkuK (DUF458 family)
MNISEIKRSLQETRTNYSAAGCEETKHYRTATKLLTAIHALERYRGQIDNEGKHTAADAITEIENQ